MRYLSVCSGIEAATVAWHPLGWQAVAFAEIEKFPSAVLAHRYPSVPNWGDLTTFRDWPDATIDLLVGGTPCQSFSVAGLRKGLADPRGNLALTFLAVVDRYRPKWVVWENVPGVLSATSHDAPDPCPPPPPVDLGCDGAEMETEDEYDAEEVHAFNCLLAGFSELGYYGAYGSLDAQYFKLAQRRERVFAVFCLGDWRRAAAVLFERESLSGHPAPRRETREDVAGTIGGSSQSGGFRTTDLDNSGAFIPEAIPLQYAEQLGREKRQNGMGLGDPGDPMYTLECRQAHGVAVSFAENQRGELVTSNTMGALKVGGDKPGQGYPAIAFGAKDYGQDAQVELSPTLRSGNEVDGHANGGVMPAVAFAELADPVAANQGRTYTREGTNNFRVSNVAIASMQVRRLTPRECERLQGFPDDYTLITYRGKPAADGPRYKALGNSMAVPVMRWIGERIALVEQVLKERAA
jgi:DNA (cytosine-5)-methyltransferase 1